MMGTTPTGGGTCPAGAQPPSPSQGVMGTGVQSPFQQVVEHPARSWPPSQGVHGHHPRGFMATIPGVSWSPSQPRSWLVMVTTPAGDGTCPSESRQDGGTHPDRLQAPSQKATGTILVGHPSRWWDPSQCPPSPAGHSHHRGGSQAPPWQVTGAIRHCPEGCEHQCCAHPVPS